MILTIRMIKSALFLNVILCLRNSNGEGGSRPEFNGPKIRRYGDTEIRERSVGVGMGGMAEDGPMW